MQMCLRSAFNSADRKLQIKGKLVLKGGKVGQKRRNLGTVDEAKKCEF